MARLNAYCSIVTRQMQNLATDQNGATAIEYAIIASGIAAAIIVTVVALGTKVQGLYGGVAAAL